MILKEPCFKNKTYFLINNWSQAIVIAHSPERAKEIMVQHTFNPDWSTAEDIEIIITGEEGIVLESL